jgi:hypothetical protein
MIGRAAPWVAIRGAARAMKVALIGLAAALAAGAAQAQTLDLSRPQLARAPAPALAVTLPGAPARAVPDLANPLDPVARPVLQPGAMESAVFAKTAIDHRFAGKSDVSGSMGFLCGLQPGHNERGGEAAYGVDPHGRFLGAKLSIAFR